MLMHNRQNRRVTSPDDVCRDEKKKKTKKTDIRLEMLMHIRQNRRVTSPDDVCRGEKKTKDEKNRYTFGNADAYQTKPSCNE